MPVANSPGLERSLELLKSEGFARRRALRLDALKPQLATLVDVPPRGREWLHESKYDGYRIVAIRHGRRVRLMSRNGLDWTRRFPEIARAVAALPGGRLVLDGEVVVPRGRRGSSFSALQEALSEERTTGYQYCVFDLLHADAYALDDAPLIVRKRLLAYLLPKEVRGSGVLKLSPYTQGDGERRYRAACRRGGEGIISKRADGLHVPGRSLEWLKVKCVSEDEFVIGGYTDPQGSRAGFGSLLLGSYDDEGDLIYAGRVGSGFDDARLRDFARKLARDARDESPFADELSSAELRGVHFVRPRYVAQIRYGEWTDDGRLRHPVFLGLREDKEARQVRSFVKKRSG